MRLLITALLALFVNIFPATAHAGKYDKYYKCAFSNASVYPCDTTAKFATPAEAAKAYGFEYATAFAKRVYTDDKYNTYTFDKPTFQGCSFFANELYQCTFNVAFSRKKLDRLPYDGETNYEPKYTETRDDTNVTLSIQGTDPSTSVPNCQPTLEAMGTEGSVIDSKGKKYVLSRARPDSICTSSCQYKEPRATTCYLLEGSKTRGFCNYIYQLQKDPEDTKYPQVCNTYTDYDDPEQGDPLNPSDETGGTDDPGDETPTDPEDGGSGNSGCTGTNCEGNNQGGGDESGNTGGGSGSGGSEGGSTGGGTGSGGSDGGGSTGGTGDGETPGTGTGGGQGGGTGTGGGSGNGSGSGGSPGTGSGSGSSGGGSSGSGEGDGSGSGDGLGSFESPGDLTLSTDQLQQRSESAATRYAASYKQTQTFQAINQFSGESHSGTCPTGSVELFDQTITFDGHCKLFDTVKPTLEVVFKAAWSILGVIIILTA